MKKLFTLFVATAMLLSAQAVTIDRAKFKQLRLAHKAQAKVETVAANQNGTNFDITVHGVDLTTADVTIAPKTTDTYWYYYKIPAQNYDQVTPASYTAYLKNYIDENYGAYIQMGFFTYADFLIQGARRDTLSALDPNTEYVVLAWGIDPTTFTATTEYDTVHLHTLEGQMSDNVITMAYDNGTLTVNTTNNDSYFFIMEKLEEYQSYESDFSQTSLKDEAKAWVSSIGENLPYFIYEGNQNIDVHNFYTTRLGNEMPNGNYVALACGYNGEYISTEAVVYELFYYVSAAPVVSPSETITIAGCMDYDFHLSVTNGGSAQITNSDCQANTVSIEATPNEGYRFTGWSDGNTDNPRTIILTADTVVIAQFEETTYQVNLSGITNGYINNYGSISGDWSGTLPADTYIQFECYPDNYPPYCGTFEGWSDGVASNYRSFYLTQDTTISAIVSGRESYQVSITAGENGYLSYSYVGQRFACKGNMNVEAYPDHGYRFAQWSDGVTENPRDIEFTQDTTITAEFVQCLYTNVKIGDLYYDLNFEDKTAIVLGANGASDGANTVSVTDRSIAEWNELPQEYVFEANCPTDAAYLGLKSVKVYADQDYINILVEPDMNELPDLEWVPFQVFIDADNSDATGGYGDMYTDANSDIYCEGAVFAEGQPYSYNPAVYKWWGEVGGSGWEWTDRSVEHDGSDYWGAIIGEGQLPVGNSQYVNGKFEIQLSRELLATAHPMNDTEFGIGFSIMQNWNSVGILPIESPTHDNPSGYAAKLKVRINKNAIPAETSELELNPNLVIPSSVTYNDENYTVTTITREAFKNHTEITSVEIPTTMTYIAYDAFEGCDSITSVVWNAINCNTYRFGSQVESFVFGNEVEVIPDELCYGMHRLTSIVVPEGVTSIGYGAFIECINLTHLYIPATVEYIGERNLVMNKQLTHLTAPASIFVGYSGNDYYYYYYASNYFSEYSSRLPNKLDTLIINRGELEIYAYGTIALSGTTLRHMDLSAIENTELQDEAFAHFYNLRSLVLPQGLEKINYMAIANCKSLESITIPASVTEIGMSAFENCYLLESVNFAQGSMLNTIGVAAFYNCHELQSINIPEGVTEIGKAAFFDCVYLNDVVVPSSVQAIGDNAFALCARMQQMRVKAVVPPSIASKTFEQVSREMPVYVPMNSVNAYKADPLWGEMNIIGVDEQFDAVDNVTTSTAATKQLINGQLYILRGDKTYTAQGQEVK